MLKKRYFKLIVFTIILVLASSAIFAFDWGIFDDYEDNIEDYALYNANKILC